MQTGDKLGEIIPGVPEIAVEKHEEKNETFKKVFYPKLVYSWGLNDEGQLGRPRSRKPTTLPKVVSVEQDGILVMSIKQIVTGAGNTFVLSDSGVVYCNGLNNIRQRGGGEFLTHRFRQLDNLEHHVIEELAMFWDTVYAVTKTGVAIGWGSNAYGQLGRDPAKMFSTRTPVEIHSESPVLQVACGQRHCVVVTKRGRVLTCGDFKLGQLGRSYDVYDYGPKEIENLRNVRQVACGQHHTIVIVKHRGELKLFAWGWNRDGQCGENPFSTGDIVQLPIEIQFPANIEKGAILKCGWRHSGLRLTSGELFLWGDNKQGQQGLPGNFPNEPFPKRIKNLSADESTKDFGLGQAHTVVILTSGLVVAWGDNSSGACGIGHTNTPVIFPLKICTGIRRVSTRVFVGYRQSFALTA